MIVELILKEQPQLELGGYEKVDLTNGVIFANPRDKRVEILFKKHPDGRVSVFTDNSEVIKMIIQRVEAIDIHTK